MVNLITKWRPKKAIWIFLVNFNLHVMMDTNTLLVKNTLLLLAGFHFSHSDPLNSLSEMLTSHWSLSIYLIYSSMKITPSCNVLWSGHIPVALCVSVTVFVVPTLNVQTAWLTASSMWCFDAIVSLGRILHIMSYSDSLAFCFFFNEHLSSKASDANLWYRTLA